jgi:hypothetical protein
MIAIAMILFFTMILVWLLAPTGAAPTDVAAPGAALVPGDASA